MSKELVKLAENFAKEKGYKKLYLEMHSNLKAAMSLYEKLGFREIDKSDCALHSTMYHFYLKDL